MSKSETQSLKEELEFQKLEAERDKLIAEKKEIVKRTNLPWYSNTSFIQMLISAILGAIAFFSFYKWVYEPSSQRDIILKEIEIANKQYQNDKQKRRIDTLNEFLQEKDHNLKVKEIELLAAISEIKQKEENLNKAISKYAKLNDDISKDLVNIRSILNHFLNSDDKKFLKEIRLVTLFFDYDKDDLRPEDVSKLDEIMSFATDNPNYGLKVVGYLAENEMTSIHGMELSIRRAENVAEYFLHYGIEPERIVAVGMGDKIPYFNFKNYKIGNQGNLLPFHRSVEIYLTTEMPSISKKE